MHGTPSSSTAVSDGTIAATETARGCTSPSASSARRGPSCHASAASCSNRSGDGTKNSCGMRDRATMLPSASAATAFTDDVPMSIPTVMLRHGAATLARAPRSTASCSRPFVHTKLPRVDVGAAVERRPATAGLFDDRDERGDVPQRHDRIDRDVERAFGDEQVLPEVADAARAPAPVRELDELRSPMPSAWKRSAVSHANESCASSSAATDDTRDRFAVAERAEPAAGPPAHAERGRRHDADDRASPARSRPMSVAQIGTPRT